MAIIENLSQSIEQRQRERQADYQRLVLAVLDGPEPQPAKAEQILSAAGKSLSDLATDTDRLRHRRELAAVVQAAATCDQEEFEVRAGLAKADSDFSALMARHQATVEPLQVDLTRLAVRRAAARDAQADLQNTADPVLLADVARPRKIVADRDRDVNEIRRELDGSGAFLAHVGNQRVEARSELPAALARALALRDAAAAEQRAAESKLLTVV